MKAYNENAAAGWHAGWCHVGEAECHRVWTAPFALFAGKPVFIGVCRIGFWNYQKIAVKVEANVSLKGKWKWAYERPIVGSPFKKGKAWRPLYPGKWRLVGCVDGRFYTSEVTNGVEFRNIKIRPLPAKEHK